MLNKRHTYVQYEKIAFDGCCVCDLCNRDPKYGNVHDASWTFIEIVDMYVMRYKSHCEDSSLMVPSKGKTRTHGVP